MIQILLHTDDGEDDPYDTGLEAIWEENGRYQPCIPRPDATVSPPVTTTTLIPTTTTIPVIMTTKVETTTLCIPITTTAEQVCRRISSTEKAHVLRCNNSNELHQYAFILLYQQHKA